MTIKKDTLPICIERARQLIDGGDIDKALATLSSLQPNLPENLGTTPKEDKQHYALFFQLLAEAKFLSDQKIDTQEIINDLDKSLSFSSNPKALQLKANILFSERNSQYIQLYQQAIEAEDSIENNLKFIIALEKNNQHQEILLR